jgi:hypothetical protein
MVICAIRRKGLDATFLFGGGLEELLKVQQVLL